VKINEIILEAINTSTGTPNRNAKPSIDFPRGAPDFSGIKQAAQGAKMLGKGVAKGAAAAGNTISKGIKAVPGLAKRIGQNAMAAGGAIANAEIPFGGSIGGVAGELAKQAMGDVNYDATVNRKGLAPGVQHYVGGIDNLPQRGSVYLIQSPANRQWYFKSFEGKWYDYNPMKPGVFEKRNAINLSDADYAKIQEPLERALDQYLMDNPDEVQVPVMSTRDPSVYVQNEKAMAQAKRDKSTRGGYTPPGPRAGRYKPGFRR
jgi:hypothetical protein